MPSAGDRALSRDARHVDVGASSVTADRVESCRVVHAGNQGECRPSANPSATIVIPRCQAAVKKARAVSIFGDVRVIQFPYSNLNAIDGTRVRNAGWGRVPAQLEEYLPGGFEFRTEFADYRWTRVRARASPFGVESAMLRVRPVRRLRPELINVIAGMANSRTTTVTRNQVRFFLAP